MTLQNFKKQHYQEYFIEYDTIPTNAIGDNGDAYYGYIPAMWVDFVEALNGIPIPTSPKIVDLGAGYCANLLYLGTVIQESNMNPELHAVEINQDYNDDMVGLISKYNLPITLHQQSYETHDISDYDIIYSFCIAREQHEYNNFNDYVLNNMKQGAIRIEALSNNDEIEGSIHTSIENNENSFEILYDNDKVIVVKKI